MFLLLLIAILLVIAAFVSAIKSHPGDRFDAYFFFLIGLAALASILPMREILLERKMAIATEKFLGHEQVIVDCNSYFDSMFYMGAAGFVYFGSGKINLEVRTCKAMRAYLDDPEKAGRNERFALHVLTHEAMHVAGTKNEIKTDCQAYQRNHRMAMLLGVPRNVAITHARQIHRERSPYTKGYYSPECEPGGNLDEKLSDAVWIKKGEPAPVIRPLEASDATHQAHHHNAGEDGLLRRSFQAIMTSIGKLIHKLLS